MSTDPKTPPRPLAAMFDALGPIKPAEAKATPIRRDPPTAPPLDSYLQNYADLVRLSATVLAEHGHANLAREIVDEATAGKVLQ